MAWCPYQHQGCQGSHAEGAELPAVCPGVPLGNGFSCGSHSHAKGVKGPSCHLWQLKHLSLGGDRGQAPTRLPLMTPIWRTVGSRPLGAHCHHSLECVTRACR
uniref:Liver-expressed antimicrobial peptide 2 n=1 Tax=Melopsittacus undulatus TaxID=13146 RepID=A0A8V5HED8_MELUD